MTAPLTLSALCAITAFAAVIAKRLDIALKVERRLGLPFFWRVG